MNLQIVEPIEHHVEQLSQEWFDLRLGRITGSRFGDLMKTGRGSKPWGDTALSMLKQVACERLTGDAVEVYTSKDMQWGIDTEPFAIEALEMATGEEIRKAGFFEIGDSAGASPDGIIISGGTAEVKCPSSKTHLSYWLDSDQLVSDYKWQVYGEMLGACTDRGFLVSYDPRMPLSHRLVFVEIKKDPIEMEKLEERIYLASEMIKEWTE